MHHSAGNDQFNFHALFLAPDTDLSTFTTERAHYCQLYNVIVSNDKMREDLDIYGSLYVTLCFVLLISMF